MTESLFPAQRDARLEEIFAILLERYGSLLTPREVWDPLTQMIFSMLSARTKTAASHQALQSVRERFGTWEAMRDAPVEEIERAMAMVTFPEAKAPALKSALLGITARYGSLTLDFLAKYRTEKIRAWLEQFGGVGPSCSAAVVNFSSLRRRALCIDAHQLRVTQRLGLTARADAATTEERLMRLAPPEWTAERLDQMHGLIELHGQTLCTFAEPACGRCPLLARCPFGGKRMQTEDSGAATGKPSPLAH